MSQNVSMVVFEGMQIPEKLIEYAKNEFGRDSQELRKCLNFYKLFGMRPTDKYGGMDNRKMIEQNVKLIEKYTNIFVHGFKEDELDGMICKPDGDAELFKRVEDKLSGTILGKPIREIFEYFKPMIHGYLDPAYILYQLAVRRPRLYKKIHDTPGGFEWVKEMTIKFKKKYRMTNAMYMCEMWEIQAIMPSSELLAKSEKSNE